MSQLPAHPTDVARQQEAARFLIQSTFGPAMADIDHLAEVGHAAWFGEQFVAPAADTHWDYVVVRKGPKGCDPCQAMYINAVMESFWKQAVEGPDQLRQRLTLALSEIFVVSTENSVVAVNAAALASYLDMLARNAFGNFRTLLKEVSTHPTMAHYLSSMRNEKEDPVTGRIPDENYAREVMQLFSIGLWELHPDGTRKQDGQGRDIPTYGQSDVMGLAKVFTGWSWAGPDTSDDRWFGWDSYSGDWKSQLQNFPKYHSNSEKRFLGTVIPAGTGGTASLDIALDTLFNHPNVGPFIGSQLIKRFVTSNPSPAYVARVTAAFDGGGDQPRGDMKAVIQAVLMDPEARSLVKLSEPNWGKLREPILRYSHFLRAFGAAAPSGAYTIWNLEDPVSSIGQNPLRAPSVFNWFRPDYAPPGDIMQTGQVAPEFQITHETTVTGYINFIALAAERQTVVFRNWLGVTDPNYLAADYAGLLGLAKVTPALLHHLNLLLCAGQLSAPTLQAIEGIVNQVSTDAANRHARVVMAIVSILISPEYIVQK